MTVVSQSRPESWLRIVPYLARMELTRRYAGSLFGAAWAIAYPVLQVGVYWAVFALGLKLNTVGGVSFGSLLIAGMVPWFAFSEGLSTITASISGNSQLVKRVVFPVELLPVSSLLAALAVHAVVVVLAVALLWFLGDAPTERIVLLAYYAGCMAIFMLAVGILLALANAVFRDVGQLLGSALWIWFWITPIVWPAKILPVHWHWLIAINPLNYLVQGYRLSLLGPGAASFEPWAILWFWGVTGAVAALAFAAFRRFKRELADLL